MSLKFFDGYEQFTGSASPISDLASAGYTFADGSAVGIVTGRTDATQCVNLTKGTMVLPLETTASKVIVGFATKITTARDVIVSLGDVVKLEWPNTIMVNGIAGTAVPILGIWYYYEIVVDKTNRLIQVYINNELDLTTTLPDDKLGVNVFDVTWALGASATKMIDDICVITDEPGQLTDRVGPTQTAIRLPTADVVAEFTASSGSAQFDMVNDLPPKDGNYVQSNTSGAMDTFRSNTVLPDGDILGVGVVVRAMKSDVDARQMGIVIGEKGATKEVLVEELPTEAGFSYAFFETDATGAAWADDTVETTPFGIVVRP